MSIIPDGSSDLDYASMTRCRSPFDSANRLSVNKVREMAVSGVGGWLKIATAGHDASLYEADQDAFEGA